MIVASVAGFVAFIIPRYGAIGELSVQKKDYETILQNARTLQEQRNTLVNKYNAFPAEDLARLNVILPTSPQNVKLILELDALASRYGMLLQNVKIQDPTSSAPAPARPGTPNANADMGTLSIDFSVAGPYSGFVSFLEAAEKSLRIIDVDAISFSAVDERSQNYQYTVGVKTYWLK